MRPTISWGLAMKVLCENYEVCFDREMALPEDERCPHLLPHSQYPMCDVKCDKEERHCKKIVLMGNEWKVLVIGYPIIARLIHGQTFDFESHKVCLIPDDQIFNEHQRITSDHLKEGK